MGDGFENDAIRLLTEEITVGTLPKLKVELFSDKGTNLRTGAGALSLRGLAAGTYFLRVFTSDRSPANFALEIAPPKDTQVQETIARRDSDLIRGGDGNDRIAGNAAVDQLQGGSGDDYFLAEDSEIQDFGGGDTKSNNLPITQLIKNSGPEREIDPIVPAPKNTLLANAIYTALSKRPGSTLRASDLQSIAYLSVPGFAVAGVGTFNVTELDGLEALTNLLVLDLPKNGLLKDNAFAAIRTRVAESGPLKGQTVGLGRLQVLNIRDSRLQLGDIASLPTTLRVLQVGSVFDATATNPNNPATAQRLGTEFSNLKNLETLQTGTSGTNLVISENSQKDGPSFSVDSQANTFQLVRNIAPVITIPQSITNFNESQSITFAGLLALPGVSVTDRDPVITSAAIIDSTGRRTSLTSQASSPSIGFASDSDAKMVVALSDRLRTTELTMESWVLVGTSALLPSTAGSSLRVIDFGSTSGNGFAIEVTNIGNAKYWTAVVNGKSMASAVQDAQVAVNAWTHVAVTISGRNVQLLINGKSIPLKPLSQNYVPPLANAKWLVGEKGFAFDELRLFNRARSQTEIQSTKDVAIDSRSANLIGYWNFDAVPAYESKRIVSSQFTNPTEYIIADEDFAFNLGKPVSAPTFSGQTAFSVGTPAANRWATGHRYAFPKPLTVSKGDTFYFYFLVPATGTSGIFDIGVGRFDKSYGGLRINTSAMPKGVWTRIEITIMRDGEILSIEGSSYDMEGPVIIDKVGLISKNVQPGVVGKNVQVQHSFTLKDLTNNGTVASVMETTIENAKPKTRFDFARATTTVNNSFTFSDDGSYALEVTSSDIDGAVTTSTTKVVVGNLAPTTDIAGKPTAAVLAGSAVSLSAIGNGPLVKGVASFDPSPTDANLLRHEWKVATITGQIVATSVAPSFQFTPQFAGSYVVTKTTTDPQGATDSDTFTLSVNPRVVFSPDATKVVSKEGTATKIDLALGSSPVSDRASRQYAWTVRQGTADVVSGTGSIVAFVPADNVPYTISATITDIFSVPVGPAQSFSSSSTMTFTPSDVAPTITVLGLDAGVTTSPVGVFSLVGQASSLSSLSSAGSQAGLPVGLSGSLSYTVADAGSLDRHKVSISWGDGKSDHNIDPLSIATHQYDVPGEYDVKLTAIDVKNNAKSNVAFKLTVTQVAPKVSVPPIASINDGQAITLVPSIVYAGAKSQNEKVVWEIVSPAGNLQTLDGREPKFTPDQSGTWGASVIVEDGFGNLVRASSRFQVNNLNPTNLVATEDPIVDGSLLRTYSGSVRDFAADRLQGKLIVQNDDAGTRVETPVVLTKQGVPNAAGIQAYNFSVSMVLGQAVGNVVSVEIVDQDGGLAIIAPSRGNSSTEDYSNAVGYGEAKHVATGPQLGDKRTPEASLPTGTAVISTGDEDGITFAGMQPGATGSLTADVRNVGTAGAQLDAWIDFDGNNSFEATEQVLKSQSVAVSGKVSFNVAVPANAKSGDWVARVRLSQPADGTLGSTGSAASGEVEDHSVSSASLTFDRDASGNLLITSVGDRADNLTASSDGTNLLFALDKVTDVTLTSAFTAAGGMLDSANKQVQIPLAQVTGETRLSTAAGSDAIELRLGKNLPKFIIDNTSLNAMANPIDTLTVTSTEGLNAASLVYSSITAGVLTLTPTAGSMQPIEFKGPTQTRLPLDTGSLSVDAVAGESMKLRSSTPAGSFDLFNREALAVSFKQPTAKLNLSATGLDLLQGFVAPIDTTFDVGSDGSIRLNGLIDTTGLSIKGNIQLEGNATLDSKGTPVDGKLSIDGNVDGGFSLTLNSGSGETNLRSVMGVGTQLSSFTTDANGVTVMQSGSISAATINVGDAVTLLGDMTFVGANANFAESLSYNGTTDGTLDIKVSSVGDLKRPILQTSTGKLSLVHSGNGVTTVRGVNTYTGLTSIDLGELKLDVGASIAGDVSVGAGGKLGGKGEVLGKTIQAPGSIINPGASPGILAIANNTLFTDEAQLKLELNGTLAGSDHDQILLTGSGISIDLGRVNLLPSMGYVANIGDTYTVVRVADPSSTQLGRFDDEQGNEIADGATFTAGGFRLEVVYHVDADLDGALNDVVFTVIDYARDFGNAPESYATEFANDGPRHRLGSGLQLGFDQSADENGLNTDDNDGVTFGELRIGDDQAQVDVFVVDTFDKAAMIDAWIDFNGDGDFDSDEKVFTQEHVVSGLNVLVLSVPDFAVAGNTYARFRLSSTGAYMPTGEVADGEIEDYPVTILSNLDLGGAPGYSSAAHIVGGPQLGNLVDMESSLIGADHADGINDEDGVIFGEVRVGGSSFVRVDASNVGSGAKLDGWIDFNRDGDFNDTNEKIFRSVAVVDGRNLLEFEMPNGSTAGATYARFRISSAGNLSPDDPDLPASDGEVEDYPLTINPSRPTATGTTLVTFVGDDLVVQDVAGGDSNDQITLRSDGVFLTIEDPNNILTSDLVLVHGDGTHSLKIPLAEIADSVIVDTLAGDDKLTVDFASGELLSRIRFVGGEGADRIEIEEGAFAGASVDVLSNASGKISFSDEEVVEYDAESVISTLSIADLTVTYGDGDDHVELMQSGTGISLSGILSFAQPQRLSINTGDGEDFVRLDDNGEAVADGSVEFIDFELIVDAGGQVGDQLAIIDRSDTSGDKFAIDSDSVSPQQGSNIFGSGGSLRYFGLERLAIDVANDNSEAKIATDDLATQLELNFSSTANNQLFVDGSIAMDTLNIAFLDRNRATLDLEAVDASVPTIEFTNVDQLDLSSIVHANSSVSYSELAETITVSDSGTAQVTRLVSSLAESPTILLTNPSETFTLHGGNSEADTMQIHGFGSGFVASVVLDGQVAADLVTWSAGVGEIGGISIRSESILLDTDSMVTSNEMRFQGNVSLVRNVALQGSSIVFEGDISAVAAQTLSIVTLELSLLGKTNLGALNVSGPISIDEDTTLVVLVGGDVTASGAISFNLPMQLIEDVTFAGSTITLAEVDSAENELQGLTLQGAATLNGVVGANSALATFKSNNLSVASGLIRTEGLQTYTGPVLLLDDLRIEGDADFGGVISGIGGLTTLNNVVLQGVNTYQGETQVVGGELRLLGSVASKIVVTDAILSGNGTIHGDLDIGVNGLLSPTPNASQWLTVDGNLSFDAEGGLLLQGIDAGTIGQVKSATIELNDAQLFDDLAFEPQLGDRLVFLQSTTLSGNFADISPQEFINVGGSDAFADYLRPASGSQEFVIVGYGVGDYGDAPFDSFKSELGAAHRNAGPALGAGRGFEEDGFVGDLQDDGVVVIGELIASSTLATTGGVMVTTTANAKLDGWIDFNHDNDWDDAGEQIFVSASLNAGGNRLAFTIPAGAFVGDTYARFRLSTAGGLAPTGIAFDGEVEDYVFTFESATAADAMTIQVGNDPTEISLEGSDIVLRVAGQVVSRIPASSVSSLVIDGDASNNTLTIDAAAIPEGGLTYNGNGSGDFDVLNIRNSADTIVSLNHHFDNAHDGSVIIDGKNIRYTGLEPIDDAAITQMRGFTFGADDDVVTLGDSGAINDGKSRITSVDSSESVDFVNPTVSMTIDLAEGNNTLVFGSLDSGLTVPITIVAGNGNDTISATTGDLDFSDKTLKKSDGNLTIPSRVIGSSFATEGNFAIVLNAGAQLSSPVIFSNTAGVTLGDATTDLFEFGGGLTSTSSVTMVQGTIHSTNAPLVFGDLVLAGNTTLTGSTITLGSITGVGNLVINGAVTLNGRIDIVGTLTVNGTLILGNDAELSFNGTTILASAIQGLFSLTKGGDGALRLNNQSFAGQLTVVDGVVELPNGLLGQLVLNGGTTVASGVLGNGLQASGGGTLQVGSGAATLTVAGDLLMANTTAVRMEINGATAGTQYDQVEVMGANRVVDLNDAVLDLSLGFVPVVGSSFTILSLSDRSSTLNGTFAGLPQDGLISVGNSQFTIDYTGGDGNDVVLTARATRELDFGDAPSSYGTMLDENGARHFATGPTLGTGRDSEPDGIASIFGDGDDIADSNFQNNGSLLFANDEDGVKQSSLSDGATTMTIYAGQENVFSIQVANAFSGAATLDAWIDWNANGTFDFDERIAARQAVVNGVNTFTFTAPTEEKVSLSTTYARFRISTAGTPYPTGLSEDGEVEDYKINVVAFNDPPTIASQSKLPLTEDSETTDFTLTGFSRGGEDEVLRLKATSNNPTLFVATSIPVGFGTEATLSLTPVPNAFGTGTVTIEARDAGQDGIFDTEDDGVAFSTITVDVTSVNDVPTGFAETLLLSLNENEGPQRIRLTDITAGARETESVTLRVSTDKPAMFRTLSHERNLDDLSVADLILETAFNQRGTAKIFVTIDDGLTTTTQTIDVVVAERNDPPKINPIPVVMLDSGTTQHTINLTGISAGANETQTLQLYVVDPLTSLASPPLQPSLVTSATTVYQSPSATGSLNLVFAAGSRGTGTVSIAVQDAGPDGIMGNVDDATHLESINVVLNSAPTMNAIPNTRELPTSGLQTVSLTGITDGDHAGQFLRVTASSSNTAAVSAPTIVYDENLVAATGQLQYTPIALGASVITVTVTDAGWDGLFDSFDDRSFVRSLVVEVTSVLHPWQNPVDPLNVDALGNVSAFDVLLLINAINRGDGGDLSNRVRTDEPYYDVNGDDMLSPLDALAVINAINRVENGEGEEANQAALEVQAVRSIGRSIQQESQDLDVWYDLNWLWDEKEVVGRKKQRTR